MNFKAIQARLSNVGTIVTLASLVVLILSTNGIAVDDERIITTVKAICSIGVLLGIFNDPNTPGLDLPFIKQNK